MMAEEFGMAGGLLLLGLYILIMIYGFYRIAVTYSLWSALARLHRCCFSTFSSILRW